MTKQIAEEEVSHVAVGVAWFVDVCNRLGLDPADRFQGAIFLSTSAKQTTDVLLNIVTVACIVKLI